MNWTINMGFMKNILIEANFEVKKAERLIAKDKRYRENRIINKHKKDI